MSYHGEASQVEWNVVSQTPAAAMGAARWAKVSMEATLPMAGLQVVREVALSSIAAMALVHEKVTNIAPLGRVYNMVQHPSLGAPFLDDSTRVDCNGRRGFAQGPNRTDCPQPEQPTFNFPDAINRAGEKTDARAMTGGEDDVQSYEVDPESPIGWVTAMNAGLGLVFGYCWPRVDYPWISLWCCSRAKGYMARGIEFGTTGLHQPFPVLAKHPRLFELPTFAFVDAGEAQTRKYT